MKPTTVTKQLKKAQKARLNLRFGKGALRSIKRALRAGKKLRARTTVTARDSAGNVTTKRLTIRIKL